MQFDNTSTPLTRFVVLSGYLRLLPKLDHPSFNLFFRYFYIFKSASLGMRFVWDFQSLKIKPKTFLKYLFTEWSKNAHLT